MKKLVRLAGMFLALTLASCGQQPVEELSIIPVPLKAELQGGAFQVNEKTQLWIEAPEADKQESQGQRSLVGCCLWGRTESDTTEAT